MRIVSEQQLKEGWLSYHRDEIPNTIVHDYRVVEKRPDGKYLVDDPPSRESPGAASPCGTR